MSIEFDKKIEESMQTMEKLRVSEFANNPVIYAKNKDNGRLLVYSKGEYADVIIAFVENLNKIEERVEKLNNNINWS